MKSSPLLFDWPHRHRIQLLLPATVIVALLAHAGALLLFDIIHPAPDFTGPNPARIYFLPASSPMHARIQGLLLTADPALYAPTQGLPTSDITTSATYTPQFKSEKPTLANLPPISRNIPKSEFRIESLQPHTSATHSPQPRLLAKKSILLTGNLANRTCSELQLHAAPPPLLPEPPSYLVGVSESGTVLHVIPYKPTGDPSIDAQLINAIRSLRFDSTTAPGTAWGMMVVRPGTSP